MNTQILLNQKQPTHELYGNIVDAYDYFNETLFADQPLPVCIITLQRKKKSAGYVCYKRWVETDKQGRFVDELALNPEYWMNWPITEVLSTLVHEQCHIWQGAYGNLGRGRYHNQEWADKMLSVGLVPSETGLPGGRMKGDKIADYIALNGLFHHAIQRLMDTGFKFSWIDKFPQGNPSRVKIFDEDGKRYTFEGELVEGNMTEARHCLLPNDTNLVALPTTENPNYNLATKGTTRVKYSCPSCKTNIWGKPNIHVICGQCKQDFQSPCAQRQSSL